MGVFVARCFIVCGVCLSCRTRPLYDVWYRWGDNGNSVNSEKREMVSVSWSSDNI